MYIHKHLCSWISLHITSPPKTKGILTHCQELLSLPLHSDTLRVRGGRSDHAGGMTTKDRGCRQDILQT